MIDIEEIILKEHPELKEKKIVQKAVEKLENSLVHETEFNNFIQANTHLDSFEFIDATLKYFNFNLTVTDQDIKNIPSSSRVVIVANYPLGGLDSIALIKLISNIRKDIKVVSTDFLEEISNFDSLLINTNGTVKVKKRDAVLDIQKALDNDMAIIMFPAGKVSKVSSKGIRDKKWKKSFLKFAQRSSSPILPIFIGGKNSKSFYSISALNKKFSKLLLAGEMFKQKDKTIEITVGELIPTETFDTTNLEEKKIIKMYRKHIYDLKKHKISMQEIS